LGLGTVYEQQTDRMTRQIDQTDRSTRQQIDRQIDVPCLLSHDSQGFGVTGNEQNLKVWHRLLVGVRVGVRFRVRVRFRVGVRVGVRIRIGHNFEWGKCLKAIFIQGQLSQQSTFKGARLNTRPMTSN
jgi:hypothetical protein